MPARFLHVPEPVPALAQDQSDWDQTLNPSGWLILAFFSPQIRISGVERRKSVHNRRSSFLLLSEKQRQLYCLPCFFCRSLSLNSTRRILPEIVLGRLSTNSISRGYL